jgi:hypothetical protein
MCSCCLSPDDCGCCSVVGLRICWHSAWCCLLVALMCGTPKAVTCSTCTTAVHASQTAASTARQGAAPAPGLGSPRGCCCTTAAQSHCCCTPAARSHCCTESHTATSTAFCAAPGTFITRQATTVKVDGSCMPLLPPPLQGLPRDALNAAVKSYAEQMGNIRHLMADLTLPLLSVFSGSGLDSALHRLFSQVGLAGGVAACTALAGPTGCLRAWPAFDGALMRHAPAWLLLCASVTGQSWSNQGTGGAGMLPSLLPRCRPTAAHCQPACGPLPPSSAAHTNRKCRCPTHPASPHRYRAPAAWRTPGCASSASPPT